MPRKERVTKVIDGDTFMTASRKNPVRLANVDAPEKGTRGGAAATKALKSMIQGETVSIDTVARDSYGRSVAKVKVGRNSVNKAVKDRLKGSVQPERNQRMPSVTKFIRNTPAASLRTYFEQADIDIPIEIDWDGPDRDIVRPLLQLVDEMDETALARVMNDAERVTKMADEAGQNALFSVIADRTTLDDLGNAHDRALWMFLNDPAGFLHAEEARFTDERRHGRMWDGFNGKPNGVLSRDAGAVEAFETAIRKRFASNNVHVDIFDRQRPTFAGEDCELIQIVVYREGLPDDDLAFNEHGKLIRRPRRPVFEAAMTYEPETGDIEVVANDRESREDMVRFLARDLLGIEFQQERLPFRQYDLSVLLRPFDFPTDPSDGVASVEVRLLRLMPIDSVGERVTLEFLGKADRSIWDMASERFGGADPLLGGWVATQAKLAIRFHPTAGSRRVRTLPLIITMPHGCNLKDQTEREQLIGEKYLRLWGILRDAG